MFSSLYVIFLKLTNQPLIMQYMFYRRDVDSFWKVANPPIIWFFFLRQCLLLIRTRYKFVSIWVSSYGNYNIVRIIYFPFISSIAHDIRKLLRERVQNICLKANHRAPKKKTLWSLQISFWQLEMPEGFGFMKFYLNRLINGDNKTLGIKFCLFALKS